jgi:aerobic carbon-monoxide dehydrogenase medium subunit
VIPAAFEYVRATSVDEAVAALAEHGDEAKLLAGGHSLLPIMKLRLAYPEVLIDIGRVDEMKGVCEDGDELVIGGATTHLDVLSNELVRQHCRILADVTKMVGDAQVRHRGTIGGALAHGDAAGDLPAVALALDAQLVAQGPGGRRTIAASDFFLDYLETALAPDEVLVEVRVPRLDGSWSGRYEKFSRVAQAWAIVGSCAIVRRDNGTIAEARIGLTHMGSIPLRASATEQALAGASTDGDAIASAAAQAAEGTSPPSDLNAQADYRQHLARVLTRRALEGAVGG